MVRLALSLQLPMAEADEGSGMSRLSADTWTSRRRIPSAL